MYNICLYQANTTWNNSLLVHISVDWINVYSSHEYRLVSFWDHLSPVINLCVTWLENFSSLDHHKPWNLQPELGTNRLRWLRCGLERLYLSLYERTVFPFLPFKYGYKPASFIIFSSFGWGGAVTTISYSNSRCWLDYITLNNTTTVTLNFNTQGFNITEFRTTLQWTT